MAYRLTPQQAPFTSVTYDTQDGGQLTVLVSYTQQSNSTTPGVAQLYSAGYRNGYISKDDLTRVTGGNLYKDAANAYNQMAAAAKLQNINLKISDTYRPLEGPYGQIDTLGKKGWYGKAAPRGTKQATGLAAQPGTSNHGWGLAIDFDQSLVWKKADGNESAAHTWLAANAADFGFSRDPNEPWHWNYIKPLETPISKPTNPTPSGTPIPPTATPVGPPLKINATDYIEKTYKQPFRDVKPSQAGVVDPTAVSAGTFNNNYQNFLKVLPSELPNTSTRKRTGPLLVGNESIEGDLILIRGLTAAQTSAETKAKNVVDSTLSTYSPTAKQDLVTSQIFELSPDRMRLKMAQTADTPNGTSHAWRAPGKLAITADITIPGMSGLRIAQMFWIDRIAENYKKFGAFQIFGITEHIDIGKGWTTSLHSRFNALPHKLLANKQLHDDEAPSNPTTTNPTQATPTTP